MSRSRGGLSVLTRVFLGWCLIAFASALVRTACPMHEPAASTRGHGAHAHHEAPTAPSAPCHCVGSCIVPVVLGLGSPPHVPEARIVLFATQHATSSAARHLDDASQVLLPFATAPPTA